MSKQEIRNPRSPRGPRWWVLLPLVALLVPAVAGAQRPNCNPYSETPQTEQDRIDCDTAVQPDPEATKIARADCPRIRASRPDGCYFVPLNADVLLPRRHVRLAVRSVSGRRIHRQVDFAGSCRQVGFDRRGGWTAAWVTCTRTFVNYGRPVILSYWRICVPDDRRYLADCL